MTWETTLPDISGIALNARWHPDVSRRIIRRLVVEGQLILKTPAHFGNGESEGIELLILRDTLDGRPLLPGASTAGALRQYLRTHQYGYYQPEGKDALAKALFGEMLDNESGIQSRVIVDDALGEGETLDTRDGVKIDGASRTAEEGKLFTFQVWQAGTYFNLRFELCLYEEDSQKEQERLLRGFAAALDALGSGLLPLGARKHRGYGQAEVTEWRVRDYDLMTTEGLLAWLDKTTDEPETNTPTYRTMTEALAVGALGDDNRSFVQVTGTFNLADSLLIRAGSDVVDMVHLNHDGQPVLSGTSLAGALRARALKIVNTLGIPDAEKHINMMFGAFGEDRRGTLTASRLIVHETKLRGGVFDRIQNRVRIDRFTGGAFDTGLFAQQPVFADSSTEVDLHLELRFPTQGEEAGWQTGLLLMLLKDLWTGDLPLGGESSVGRGRLRGRELTITFQQDDRQQTVKLMANADGSLHMDNPAVLESYVYELVGKAHHL